MIEIKPKKLLFIKISLFILMSSITPVALFFFFKLNFFQLAGLGLLIPLLSISLLFFILKPINALIAGAGFLAKGNLNFRVNIKSGDELEQAGDAFNLMASKLQQAITSIENDKDFVSGERNRLSMILSSVVDGIIAIDFSKRIVMMNRAAEEITGYSASELEQKPIEQFIRFYAEKEELSAKTYCQPQDNKILTVTGKNGKQINVSLTTTQAHTQIQTNLSCTLVLHDLTKESELEQMKLDFVSMASHELKTPLTSITGYLSVFIEENKNKIPKEELELVEKSFIASKQLYTLVANILNVNKIERGQISVMAQEIDLEPILKKGVEDLLDQAKLKGIDLTLQTTQSPIPKVTADPVRISEVVVNLISNAINYSNTKGKITVSATVMPNEVVTTIEDNGVGIPKDALPHLFNKFFRVSNTAQKNDKGTGLGLYIAKSIIEKLNGKIWVESEFGQGSRFHFSLPLATQISQGKLNTQQFVSTSIQQGALNYS